MTIETNGRRFVIDVDPLLIFIYLGEKVDKKIIADIATPNFSIVIRPSRRTNFSTKEGDYDIIVRKDNGEETMLNMPHRGAKMLYMLVLLCQKAVGGLSYKFFKNEKAVAVIKALYDKVYRSGGEQWVNNCATNTHNLSIYRNHAKNAVEESEKLENMIRYWCGFENEKRTVGKKQLQLRKIRIPDERIIVEDAAESTVSFNELIRQLPTLEDLFGFRNKTTERLRELRLQRANNVLPHC